MTELVGLAGRNRQRNGWLSAILAAIGGVVRRLRPASRGSRLNAEEWSDYLLRDIGLPGAARDRQDPRALPTSWPLR